MANGETGFIVVGIGELLWDELPTGRRLGGAPANFAYHCQILGANSVIVSAVGDDEAGRAIHDDLDQRRLDSSHVGIDHKHPTGSVSVVLAPEGIPEYAITEKVAWDYISRTSEQLELASEADAVCFGTLAQRSAYSRKTIRSFLRVTRPNCLRIFDVNLRQAYYDHNLLRENLGLANVLKLNESELIILASLLGIKGETQSLLDQLATRYSLNAIAVTQAERGCIIRTDEQTIRHDGFSQERILDTVGAGDCFSAVLTMGLLREEPLDSIAAQANWLAAYVCTQEGGMPEMP